MDNTSSNPTSLPTPQGSSRLSIWDYCMLALVPLGAILFLVGRSLLTQVDNAANPMHPSHDVPVAMGSFLILTGLVTLGFVSVVLLIHWFNEFRVQRRFTLRALFALMTLAGIMTGIAGLAIPR
jgi:hypothetical protein